MAKPRILQQLDGELSTDIVLNSDPDQSMEAVTKQYVDAIEDDAIEYMNNNLLSKNDDSGSNITLTNANITLKNDPTADMQAATKQYVDNSGGTFYAIYGSTLYNDIVNAYQQGKIVKALQDNYIYDLLTVPNNNNDLYFVRPEPQSYEALDFDGVYLKIISNNTWSLKQKTNKLINQPLYLTEDKNVPLSSTYRYYRPIMISTSAPSSDKGEIGDIWIQYSK